MTNICQDQTKIVLQVHSVLDTIACSTASYFLHRFCSTWDPYNGLVQSKGFSFSNTAYRLYATFRRMSLSLFSGINMVCLTVNLLRLRSSSLIP
jgi:hypothetical protein